MPCAKLTIIGKVQGVFYRASAKDKAVLWDIKGWIKNLPDGNVEAVACGEEANLRRFIEWCRQGPVHADVEQLIEEPFDPQDEEFVKFSVLRADE